MDVVKYASEAYASNIKLVLFFSLPFLLAFLIPVFSPMPTFTAVGASFLRTGSMYVDLTSFDIAIIVLSFLVSMFLISFAIVSINLIIKSQRTFTNIKKEVLDGIEKYVVSVFWLYTTAWILILIVNLFSYEWNLNEFITPIFAFLISLPLFYAPTAMVIDEQRPIRAMATSLEMIKRQFGLFILWLIIGSAALSLIDFIFILIQAYIPYATLIPLTLNALFVLPFLIMLQVQIYLTKYTILK